MHLCADHAGVGLSPALQHSHASTMRSKPDAISSSGSVATEPLGITELFMLRVWNSPFEQLELYCAFF